MEKQKEKQNETQKASLKASFKDQKGNLRRFDLSEYSIIDTKIFCTQMQDLGFELIKFS